jgi:predicted RNA-binding protein with TRAM domain
MSRQFAVSAVLVALSMGRPAIAQDAQAGKEYEITIASEEDNQYTGPFGKAMIGKVAVLVPNAKKDQKYKVKITAIKENQYTGDTQASCDFEQIGGDRKGSCIGAP